MYELLTHRFPYDYAQLRSRKDAEQLPQPQSLEEKVPEDLASVVNRALSFKRENRYSNFEVFQADLENKCDIREPQSRLEMPVSHVSAVSQEEIPRFLWICTGLALFLLFIYLVQEMRSEQNHSNLPVLEEMKYE